jgi:hypothetical protein
MDGFAFIARDVSGSADAVGLVDEAWISAGHRALEEYLAKVVAFEEFLSEREECG